ncbi:expansin-like protein [Dictyostelium discoideum AX4]|uniref:Expansin-like protein 9 n=1 Tax=Dictyostelium discoideum TaxID=44689 RepID=EXPL9_DICDI|nr:expansin-like protein [Dictyostelium discoideum AX4]Q54C78.1 RecName: Full=Expansin-like protein 9; Short=Ddexpl9; Flags: Precursor [Dictyostelium discoideum]EAL60926.1 expansin-like protein [Dictyostelium discoideum AX4]|eukprot:XP_629341.1 expansin-like protein [Dictyostelium discoideum AX4]
MKINKNNYFKIIIFIIYVIINLINASDNVKLSNCGQARAEPTFKQSENGGQCQLPPPSIGTAALSLSAFNGGARCGQCYELTGPLGKTVVMVTDGCNSGEACTQKDLFNFIISNKDFDKIGNSSSYVNIYSLGYQEVSCGFLGNIKIKFGGSLGHNGKVDYSYYFTVSFSNFNIGIKQVQILGTGMVSYMKLKRSLGGFTWNQESGGSKLQFPATLVLTGVDGQIISYKFRQPPANIAIDMKKQFIPQVGLLSSKFNQSEICGMGNVPEYIYEDSLTFGWIVSNSWRFNVFNLSSQDTDDNPTLGESVIKMDLAANGGLAFTREGGFQTKYLESLKVMIKVLPPTNSLQCFFGASGIYVIPGPLGGDWQEISIPISVLKPQKVEYSLSFYNNQGQSITMWIDNIKWIFSPEAPPTPLIITDPTVTPPPLPQSIVTAAAGVVGLNSIGITSNKGGVANLVDGSSNDDDGTGGTGGGASNKVGKRVDGEDGDNFMGGNNAFSYYNDDNSSNILLFSFNITLTFLLLSLIINILLLLF